MALQHGAAQAVCTAIQAPSVLHVWRYSPVAEMLAVSKSSYSSEAYKGPAEASCRSMQRYHESIQNFCPKNKTLLQTYYSSVIAVLTKR